LRTGAGAMILVQKGLNAFSGLAAPEEFGLAAAVTSEAAERLSRYRRAHEKGLHQGLQRLRELRADSPQRPVLNLIRPL
jgi:hypothetical protein